MMQKVYSKGFNGWSQLAILLGLVGAGMLIGTVVSIPIWKAMTGAGIMNIEQDILKPENAQAAQVMQAVSAICMFVIPTIVFARICYRKAWLYLGFAEPWNPKTLLIVLLILVCSIPVMGLLEQLNRAIPLPTATRLRFDMLEKKYNEQVLAMIQLHSWGQYFSSLLIIAVLPAVSEELVFRGGLQNLLTRWLQSPWVGIVITSLLFSAIHLSWYGFIVRFALGMVLGLIFYHSKNIWLNILVHFINNALVVTTLFIMSRQGKPLSMTSDDSFPWIVGVAAMVIIVALIYWLIKSSPKRNVEDDSIIVFDRNNPFA